VKLLDASLIKNMQFGQWTVLRRVEQGNHRTRWICRCSCGNERHVEQNNLRSGGSTKCRDCITRGDSGFKAILRQYKSNSVIREIAWELADDEAKVLFQGECHYCGIIPSRIRRCHTKVITNKGDFIFNGIDRKDSQKNYTIENCVSCCKQCNYMKRDTSYEQFLEQIKRIYRRIEHS